MEAVYSGTHPSEIVFETLRQRLTWFMRAYELAERVSYLERTRLFSSKSPQNCHPPNHHKIVILSEGSRGFMREPESRGEAEGPVLSAAEGTCHRACSTSNVRRFLARIKHHRSPERAAGPADTPLILARKVLTSVLEHAWRQVLRLRAARFAQDDRFRGRWRDTASPETGF